MCIVGLLTSTLAFAHEYSKDGLLVHHLVILETTPIAKSAGGYLSVTNNGPQPDRLIAVEADFPRVMLHETVTKDGIAEMLHRGGFDIAPGETLVLERGAKHVMFMGLSEGLPAGTEIDATLIFEKAGAVPVIFQVEAPSDGKAKDHSDHATN